MQVRSRTADVDALTSRKRPRGARKRRRILFPVRRNSSGSSARVLQRSKSLPHAQKTRLIEFGRHAARRRAARGLGKPGDVQLPWVHAHLWPHAARRVRATALDAPRSDANRAAENQGTVASQPASRDPGARCAATAGGAGVLRVPRCAHQRPTHEQLPALRRQVLAVGTASAQSEGFVLMGPHEAVSRPLATVSTCSASVARQALRRYSPKVGARCVNRARRDLCGGCSAMDIPTATIGRLPLVARDFRRTSPRSRPQGSCVRRAHTAFPAAQAARRGRGSTASMALNRIPGFPD